MPATEISGRVVLERHVVAGRISVADGRIAAVREDSSVSGPLICPGFVDVHVHGWGGHDAAAGRSALEGMARGLIARGVTAFLPTAIPAPLEELADFADRLRGWLPFAPRDGAEPLGFAMEGPFVTRAPEGPTEVPGMAIPAATPPEEMARLMGGLKLITIAPELPGALDAIRRFTDAGVIVALGHSRATAAEALAGYAAGALSTTHLFNEMSGVHHREPGLAAAALFDDDAWVELIADGHHVDRVLWPLVLRAKPPGRVLLVSDAIHLADTPEGEAELAGQAAVVRDGQCRLKSNGRIAGSVIALDQAVKNMVAAGVELPRAVAMATRAPADLLGLADRGRLAIGCRADLVELNDRLEVVRVMREGRWVVDNAAGKEV